MLCYDNVRGIPTVHSLSAAIMIREDLVPYGQHVTNIFPMYWQLWPRFLINILNTNYSLITMKPVNISLFWPWGNRQYVYWYPKPLQSISFITLTQFPKENLLNMCRRKLKLWKETHTYNTTVLNSHPTNERWNMLITSSVRWKVIIHKTCTQSAYC